MPRHIDRERRSGAGSSCAALGFALALALSPLCAASALAQASVAPRDGWAVFETDLSFAALAQRLDDAIQAEKMGRVTFASASDGARMQGIEIPGNRVVGVYRNDYARRMLAASVAAGIEAPIRFYITEDADGGATLSYKTPSLVFEPYFQEGGQDLRDLAVELDAVFADIAARATAE